MPRRGGLLLPPPDRHGEGRGRRHLSAGAGRATSGEPDVRPLRTHADVLAELLDLEGRTVVDVGCGDGSATRPLAARARALTGVEPSPSALEAAVAGRSPAGERYVAGSAEALPLPAQAADVVLFLNSLHHVDDLGAALAEATRVLRPGGILYAQEPLAEGTFFALLRLVDDETAVREAAQAALRAPRAPLEALREVEYDAPVVLAGPHAFHERVLMADPDRAGALHERRAELEARFAGAGEPHPEGVLFRQPTRVTLLRRTDPPGAGTHAYR